MTLAELLLSLTIAAILATMAVTPSRRALDALHVRAAREAVFGAAMRTRSVAIAQGGADLTLDLQARTATVANSAGLIVTSISIAQHNVVIDAGTTTWPIMLHYDGRGIGRMASRTIRFQRGDAQAGLTFSSYGRVHRW